MNVAKLEQGFVIRYNDKLWRVAERAICIAYGGGCVILAQIHDPLYDVFMDGRVALVFDSSDEEVFVDRFESSPLNFPEDWTVA